MSYKLESNRGRPKQYTNGAKEHAKEIKYSTDYYRNNKGEKCICDICKKEVSKWTLKQHLKSKTCQHIKSLLNI